MLMFTETLFPRERTHDELGEIKGITCKRELLCHGQGLARSLLPSAVVRRNFINDKLSTCIYCTLQLLVVQVVVQKSTLDRKTLLLIGIPGPGNAS